MKQRLKEKSFIQFGLLLILIVMTFSVAFNSGFLPWDDDVYVTENNAVKEISGKNIKTIFSRAYAGNYQPVTMLTYMADYFFCGEKAFCFHFTNLLFHFLNSVLLLLLLRKLLNNNLASLLGAMIFAIHPLQSETVMWIAERKNVMYVFFFLLASIYYFKFLDQKKMTYYLAVLFFFSLSLLSKATAVAFPLCMICYDLMYNKKFELKSLLNKIPFFILALIFGLITISYQKEAGFINEEHNFNFLTKTVYAGYAYAIYVFKFFFPVSLSSYYPYPQNIQFAQIILAFVSIVILVFIAILLRRKKFLEAGGLLFFTSNIIFVLQFIPFGEVLVAERYNYLSSVGIIITVAGFLISIQSKIKNKTVVSIGVICIGIVFGITCSSRNKTWKDSVVFYKDILKKFPESYVITNSLGAEYMKKNDFASAQEWFEKTKKIKPDYYSVYYNEGLNYLKQNKIEKAYNSLSKSIELHPYYKALMARATILEQNNQEKAAIDDLDLIIKMKPDHAKAHHLRAICKEKLRRFDEALADYDRAIKLDPEEAIFHLNKGIALGKAGRFHETLSEFNVAISLKPDYAQAYYARSISKQQLGQNPCEDLKKASELGYKPASDAVLQYCR